MNDELVSVVIPTWNLKKDLGECIDSIKSSTYNCYEIIVVDNNSTDGTIELLNESYKDVILIRNSENLGFAAAVNKGIEKAIDLDSKFVFVLNNDAIIYPSTLTRLVEISRSISRLGIIVPKVMFYDHQDIIYSIGDKVFPLFPIPIRIGFKKKDRQKYNKIFHLDYVTGCAMLIPIETIKKVGFFNENFFMYYEDAEFCFRTKKENLKIICDGNNRVLHKVALSSKNIKAKIIRMRAKNRIIFFSRYHHGIFGFLSIPLILFIDILKLVNMFFIKREKERGRAYLSGIISGLKKITKRTIKRDTEI